MTNLCCDGKTIDYTAMPKRTNVQLRAADFSSGKAMTKVVLKAKPEIFNAIFLSGRHGVRGKTHTFGCIVEFPHEVIYFTEDELSKYFEILEEGE